MPNVYASVALRAAQQPPWTSAEELYNVCDDLRTRPPLVDSADCHALHADLAAVAAGEAFVIQGGDCAERFADSAAHRVEAKAAHLTALGDRVTAKTGLPAVHIGRLAGQYSKPRSSSMETVPDGRSLAVYRGDAVNEPHQTVFARRSDPQRLLLAYDHAATALSALRPRSTYTSHEALLLDFEEALVRPDNAYGSEYASSAHLLWIGERTRQLDGAHLAFAERIANPVGVKIGPKTTPSDVAAITRRLARDHAPGRLMLISRMGASAVADRLPALLDAAGPYADRIVWLCDPMHGNTCLTASGEKTRVLTEIVREVAGFFGALRAAGVRPGGLHLELTPDAVTECVDSTADLLRTEPLERYESACDPRLNPEQTEHLLTEALSFL
jgi:3-deoxy-7-phosphoheptulonate synthase